MFSHAESKLHADQRGLSSPRKNSITGTIIYTSEKAEIYALSSFLEAQILWWLSLKTTVYPTGKYCHIFTFHFCLQCSLQNYPSSLQPALSSQLKHLAERANLSKICKLHDKESCSNSAAETSGEREVLCYTQNVKARMLNETIYGAHIIGLMLTETCKAMSIRSGNIGWGQLL